MFRLCVDIYEMNLSNFDTSEITNMHSMFNGLKTLTSMDVSNFNTSKVMDMQFLFHECILLTSLNLSNFDFSQVTYIFNMFSKCSKLKYINLKNYDERKIVKYTNMFNGVRDNLIICLDEKNNIEKILSQLNSLCYIIDCSDEFNLQQKKIINKETENCIYNCDNKNYNYDTMENVKIIVL